MATITINIKDEVLDKLRFLASKEEHKKGFLGRTITEATKKYLEEKEQEKIANEMIALLDQDIDIGKILTKNRSELYERR